MRTKDGMEDALQATIDNNQDPYGKAGVDFMIQWADLMEARIDAGEKLEDVAKECSHEADTEGITVFMYGCAASILSQVWAHGEEFRIWHNLDTQIGDEGERANEKGGTLNSALMSAGKGA